MWFILMTQISAVFVQIQAFDEKVMSVNSEPISEIATFCHITVVLISYENDTQPKIS